MKKFSIFLLVIAVIAALVYYFFPLEMLVKKAVNKYGSEVTGTSVNLSGFNINLKDGEASVKQITVANPQNYKTKYAVELGNIDVKVNLKSVTTDTIIVDKIIVNKPVISYEMKSLTENNISEIIDNVNKYTSSSATEPAQEEAGSRVGAGQVLAVEGRKRRRCGAKRISERQEKADCHVGTCQVGGTCR